MEQYISKSVVVAEIDEIVRGLQKNCNPNPMGNMQECLAAAQIEAINLIKDFLDTLEMKDMSMPVLDNGNMSVERWKEACEAASCQANYRKSKGCTETCDDYFVDGVQWADEHPKKVKEVDLEKEIKEEYLKHRRYGGRDNMLVILNEPQFNKIAKHFFELGLKTSST